MEGSSHGVASEPMGEPPLATHDIVWSRVPGWVDRVVGDNVFVRGRHGEDRTVGGLAAAVWMVLDEPGTQEEITSRIRESWPGSPVEHNIVDDALALLETHGVVSRDLLKSDAQVHRAARDTV